MMMMVMMMMLLLVMMVATRCDCVFVTRIGGPVLTLVSALTPQFLYYSPHAVSAVMSLDFSCAVFSCQSFCTFDVYIYNIYNATVDVLVIDTLAIASR